MKKQLFIFLAILFGFVAPAAAQSYVGSWELFSSYGTPSRMVETPDYVYVLAGSTLCAYDKATGETMSYNSTNRLNGNKATAFWYDPDMRYLLVVYEDFNIDLVYDDGRIINVPDLRDAAITDSKTVNNVSFANGNAFLGTASGMIVIDATHGAVTESCLWGKNITYIAATDKKIMLWVGWYSANEMYIADQAGSHHNFDKVFSKVTGGFYPTTGLTRLSGDKICASNAANVFLFTVNGDQVTRTMAFGGKSIKALNTVPTRNGLMITMGTGIAYIAKDGTVTEKSVDAANGHLAADWNGTGATVWLADANGYGKYDTATSAFAINKVKPRGTSGSNVGRIVQHDNGNFYISTAEQNENTTIYNLAFYKTPAVDIYSPSTGNFTAVPSSLLKLSMSGFDADPTDANRIFTGYHAGGGRNINLANGSVLDYGPSNTAFTAAGSYTAMKVDGSGNLWVCQKTGSIVNVGKALKGSWETTSNQAGWSFITLPVITCNHSTRMVVDEAHGVILVTGRNGIAALRMPDADKPLTANTKTTYIDCSVDSDGSSLSPSIIPALAIDKNGRIWAGYDKGVFVIGNANNLFESGFAPMRPKVPRNDGTNLADYLLDQVEVLCIAVDENNKKWIGTFGSGLYRVSEDGTSIIEHFTVDNCDIPSNNVMAVCADRNSNDIYVGTSDGLSIYHSTTAPAADDYENVYAYPNPVTPDFTGYVTITGLKANSLIKITDSAGNPLYEARSDGGMAVWNGCDASGRRVRSGVYFVFASEIDEGATGAAVTKIVVVN